MKTEVEEKNRIYFGTLVVFKYIPKNRWYSHDWLLVWEATQKEKAFLGSDESTPTVWSLFIYNLRLHYGFQNSQDMWEMVASQCGMRTQQAAAIVGMGWVDSSSTENRVYSRSLSHFSWPFASFLHCSIGLSTSALEKRTISTAFDLHPHKVRWDWTHISEVMNWAPGSCISRGNLLPISYL